MSPKTLYSLVLEEQSMERYVRLPEGGRVFATVEGAGSPVLFVHADFVDGGMWTRTMAALAAGHLVASYDKLGYGTLRCGDRPGLSPQRARCRRGGARPGPGPPRRLLQRGAGLARPGPRLGFGADTRPEKDAVDKETETKNKGVNANRDTRIAAYRRDRDARNLGIGIDRAGNQAKVSLAQFAFQPPKAPFLGVAGARADGPDAKLEGAVDNLGRLVDRAKFGPLPDLMDLAHPERQQQQLADKAKGASSDLIVGTKTSGTFSSVAAAMIGSGGAASQIVENTAKTAKTTAIIAMNTAKRPKLLAGNH